MPINGMNVGADYSLGYFDSSTGQLVDFGDVQNVRLTAQKHDVSSKPYNNVPRYGYIPDGHKFEFTITRTGSVIEDIMVAFEAAFNNGTVQKPGFLNESVVNPDGTIRRYQYTNCVLFLTDHGDISRDKVVTQRLEGYASQKIQIA